MFYIDGQNGAYKENKSERAREREESLGFDSKAINLSVHY